MKRICLLLLMSAVSLAAVSMQSAQRLKVGKSPQFSDLSADGKRLFVTSFASSKVSVVDTQSLETIGAFYGGYEPIGIGVSPAGDKIFVANSSNGVVKAVDARTYDVLDDIKVGGRPTNIVVAPSGQMVFVLNFGRGKYGKVDFIDTSTHRILSELEIGVTPYAAVVSAFGDRLFVVCAGSNEMYVIDIGTRTIVRQLPVGQGPRSLPMDRPSMSRTAEPTTSPSWTSLSSKRPKECR